MENYRTIVGLVKVKEFRKAGKYEEAHQIIKQLNVKYVKELVDLNMLADVCNEVGDYAIAEQVYEKIYKKKGSKHALGSLLYMKIKLKKADEARNLLEKYELAAPNDPSRLIYKYRVEKLEKAPLEQQIATLEAWKREDYSEKWGAELAKLYHKAGDKEKCIEECNHIIMWFGEGDYVEWAKTLLAHLNGEIDITELASRQKAMREAAEAEHKAELEAKRAAYEEELSVEEEKEQQSVCEAEEDAESAEVLDVSESETTGGVVKEAEFENAGGAIKEAEFENAGVSNKENGISEENTEETSDEDEILLEAERNISYGNSEYELAVMESVIQYLSDNCSPNFNLREETLEVPEIGGEFGEKIASGEILLEDIFGNYARMDSVRKQLGRSLDMIFDPLKKGNNLIITGSPKYGKTTLAKKIAKTMNNYGELKSTKALIIDADSLNKHDLSRESEKLIDCTIIIERAGKLKRNTIEAMLALEAGLEGKTVVFLEDERKNINNLLRDNPELNSVFNNRIHLPSEYKLNDLMGFAFEYLISKEYELEKPAVNTLEEKIVSLMGKKEKDPVRATIDIVKAAIDKAESRNGMILAGMVKSGKLENTDIMTIHADDFE